MIPFRGQPPTPRLREGYRLVAESQPEAAALNHLLERAGDRSRSPERWQRVLDCSAWHLAVHDPQERLVGFVRATSDQALNANLWDLMTDPDDPAREEVLLVVLRSALARLRRELPGCSVSLSAPPEALTTLEACGFLVDPGGIRAMGLRLDGR